MALGDALAVALLDARGFREHDFARSHPGGSLGRKLLMHVRDLMRSGDALPVVGPQADLNDDAARDDRQGPRLRRRWPTTSGACSASSPTATCGG